MQCSHFQASAASAQVFRRAGLQDPNGLSVQASYGCNKGKGFPRRTEGIPTSDRSNHISSHCTDHTDHFQGSASSVQVPTELIYPGLNGLHRCPPTGAKRGKCFTRRTGNSRPDQIRSLSTQIIHRSFSRTCHHLDTFPRGRIYTL